MDTSMYGIPQMAPVQAPPQPMLMPATPPMLMPAQAPPTAFLPPGPQLAPPGPQLAPPGPQLAPGVAGTMSIWNNNDLYNSMVRDSQVPAPTPASIQATSNTPANYGNPAGKANAQGIDAGNSQEGALHSLLRDAIKANPKLLDSGDSTELDKLKAQYTQQFLLPLMQRGVPESNLKRYEELFGTTFDNVKDQIAKETQGGVSSPERGFYGAAATQASMIPVAAGGVEKIFGTTIPSIADAALRAGAYGANKSADLADYLYNKLGIDAPATRKHIGDYLGIDNAAHYRLPTGQTLLGDFAQGNESFINKAVDSVSSPELLASKAAATKDLADWQAANPNASTPERILAGLKATGGHIYGLEAALAEIGAPGGVIGAGAKVLAGIKGVKEIQALDKTAHVASEAAATAEAAQLSGVKTAAEAAKAAETAKASQVAEAAAKIARGSPKLQKTATTLGLAAYFSEQAVTERQAAIRETMPLDELLAKSPQNAQEYDKTQQFVNATASGNPPKNAEGQLIGLDGKPRDAPLLIAPNASPAYLHTLAEKLFRYGVADRALATDTALHYAANSIPLLPGLGAASKLLNRAAPVGEAAAKLANANVLRRSAHVALEGVKSGVEVGAIIGGNKLAANVADQVSQNTPGSVFAGVPEAAGSGLPFGFLGAAGAARDLPARPGAPDTSVNTPQTADTTQTTATPTGPIVPPTGGAAATSALKPNEFSGIQKKVVAAVTASRKTKSEAMALDTPESLVTRAHSMAQDLVDNSGPTPFSALTLDQQHSLIDDVATSLNGLRGKANAFPDLAPTLEQYKADRATVTAQSTAAPPVAQPANPITEPDVPPAALPVPQAAAQAAPVEPPPIATEAQVRQAVDEAGTGTTPLANTAAAQRTNVLRTTPQEAQDELAQKTTVSALLAKEGGKKNSANVKALIQRAKAVKQALYDKGHPETVYTDMPLAQAEAYNQTAPTKTVGDILGGNPTTDVHNESTQLARTLLGKGGLLQNITGLTLPEARIHVKSTKKVNPLTRTNTDALAGRSTNRVAGTPSPKPEAPLASENQPGQVTSSQPLENVSESPKQVVERVASDLTNEQKAELTSALDLAHKDAPAELQAQLNDLLTNEDITPEQARKIRKSVTEGLARAKEMKAAEAVTRAEEVKAANDKRIGSVDGTHPVQASDAPENPAIREVLNKSPTSIGDFLREIINKAGMRPEQIDLAKTLAKIADKLHINLESSQLHDTAPVGHEGHAGWYNSGTDTVHIKQATATNSLHEILHAVTANLLKSSKNALVGDIRAQLEQLRSHLRQYIADNPNSVQTSDLKSLLQKNQGPLGNVSELLAYGMTEKPFQELLSRIPAPARTGWKSLWDGFRNAIASIFPKLAPKERTALDALMEPSNKLLAFADANPSDVTSAAGSSEVHPSMLSRAKELIGMDVASKDIKEAEAEGFSPSGPSSVSVFKASVLEHVDSSRPFKELQDLVSRVGGNVKAQLWAARIRLASDLGEIVEQDNQRGRYPFADWLKKNYSRFGGTAKIALDNLNMFFHNTHVLERNKVFWLLRGQLAPGKDAVRTAIMHSFEAHDLTPQQTRAKLEALSAAHSLETAVEFGRKNINNFDNLPTQLATLKAKGIDTNTTKDANALLQVARDISKQRLLDSGNTPDLRRIELYGFEHYVPLKGNKKIDKSKLGLAALDMDGEQGAKSLAVFNKQLTAMRGRKTVADTPIQQLFNDMTMHGADTARKKFTEVVLQFVNDNAALMGATIRVWTGEPVGGYTLISGNAKKGQTFRSALPVADKLLGFIHHDGDTHYVVTFPSGKLKLPGFGEFNTNLMIQGFQGLRNSREPSILGMHVSKATGVWSRLLTTVNPMWTTVKAFPRDLGFMPIMLSIKESANAKDVGVLKAYASGAGLFAKYMGNLLKNGFRISNFEGAKALLMNDRLALQSIAKRDPNGQVAWLLRMEKAGGATHFSAQLSNERITQELTGKYDAATGLTRLAVAPAKGWHAYNELAQRYAQMLENIGRVAAFRTLVESGYSEFTAATNIKDYLNFDQSGRSSRNINNYIPFFKIGMTSIDSMVRTFQDKQGNFDKAKLAMWAPAYAAMGFLAYTMTKQLLGQDDKGKWIIDQYSLDDLTGGGIIPVGDTAYMVPFQYGLPQVLMGPGVLAGALYDSQNGNSTRRPDEIGRAFYSILERNAPVRPKALPKDWGWGDVAIAWTTGAVETSGVWSPLSEVTNNRSGFGTDIHTTHPDKSKAKSDQGRSGTAPEWKELAAALKEHAHIDMYPEDIQYLVKNYSGSGMSAIINGTIGVNNSNLGGVPENALTRASGIEVRKSFYQSNQIDNTLEDLSGATQRAAHIKADAVLNGSTDTEAQDAVDAWMVAHPVEARQLAAHKALVGAQAKWFDDVKAIREKKLDPRGAEMQRKLADSKLRKAMELAQKSIPKD